MAKRNDLAATDDTRGLGPAMLACNPRQRAFVFALFEQKPGYGALVAAARAAGYGTPDTTAHTFNSIAQRLANDPKVIDAIQEVTRKRIRSLGPQSVQAVQEIMNDQMHKDRLKAARMVLQRIDPEVEKIEATVTHQVDHTAEALAQLRMLKSLGVAREKLIEVFGYSGLDRYEEMLALEDKRETAIDVEFSEIEPGDDAELSSAGIEDLL